MIDARKAAILQARAMWAHPWDVGTWLGWWAAGAQGYAEDPIGAWRAAVTAQTEQALAVLDWLASLRAEADRLP